MYFSYSNTQVEKEVADKLNIPQELVKKVFAHQCQYTYDKMQEDIKFVRWYYIGAFVLNIPHRQKVTEILNLKTKNQ